MKSKMNAKIIIDILMTILLPILMAYMITGQQIHEWIGMTMFLLFIAHHILNRKWFGSLLKGKYNVLRATRLIVDTLVLIDMIGLMISGIMMSGYVFSFLPISGGMVFARKVHLLASYWGLILMSVHLGLHWNIVMERIRRAFDEKNSSKVRTLILKLFGLAIAVCGISSFRKQGIGNYLFMKNEFVFWDNSQGLVSMLWQYFAIIGLFVYVAYYAVKGMNKLRRK